MLVVEKGISGALLLTSLCCISSAVTLAFPWAPRLVRTTAQSSATPFVHFLFLKGFCETELKSSYQRK